MKREQERLTQLGYSFELDYSEEISPGTPDYMPPRESFAVLVKYEDRPIGYSKAKSSYDALQAGIEIAQEHEALNAGRKRVTEGWGMVTKTFRGKGKLYKAGKHLCDTNFEITSQDPYEAGPTKIIGYLSGFDPMPLLGLAGETLVLRLSDGAEQEILLREDTYDKSHWQFRPTMPVNSKFDPRLM